MGHLDWGLDTKGPYSDPADKTFLGLHIVSKCFKVVKPFVKNGVKTSVAGSCTNESEFSNAEGISSLAYSRIPLPFVFLSNMYGVA